MVDNVSYTARTNNRPHSRSTVRLLNQENFDGMCTRNRSGTSLSHPLLGTGLSTGPSIYRYRNFIAISSQLHFHSYGERGNDSHDDVAVVVIGSQSDVATSRDAHTA